MNLLHICCRCGALSKALTRTVRVWVPRSPTKASPDRMPLSRSLPPPPPRESSWGGSTILHDGVWHLFVSQMANGTDLRWWKKASFVAHCTSSTPSGSLGALTRVGSQGGKLETMWWHVHPLTPTCFLIACACTVMQAGPAIRKVSRVRVPFGMAFGTSH